MKLKTILACDRVIEEIGAGPTLLTTFQQIIATLPKDQSVPTNALLPKAWSIYTVWALEEHENNRDYTQVCEMFWPDGSEFFHAELPSTSDKADQFLTFTGRLAGFPIGQPGRLVIRVWMEEGGVTVAAPEETWVSVIHKQDEADETAGS